MVLRRLEYQQFLTEIMEEVGMNCQSFVTSIGSLAGSYPFSNIPTGRSFSILTALDSS